MVQTTVFEGLKNTTGTDALPLEYKCNTTGICGLVILSQICSPTIWLTSFVSQYLLGRSANMINTWHFL